MRHRISQKISMAKVLQIHMPMKTSQPLCPNISRLSRMLLLVIGLLMVSVMSLAFGRPAFAIDLTVTQLEATQSMQHLDNPSFPDNSLPLIRGRRTVVRMYVGVTGSRGAVAGVDGTLRVFVNGVELAGSPFSSENGPITAPLVPDREETDHTLNLQYSPDKGQTFLPLAVNLTRNRFTLDTTQIPGGQEAILRLFASDGLNTTMDEVAGLTVGERKLPTVRIVEPGTKSREAVRLRQGAPLLLVGYGYDPEDGFLPDKALSWSSSLDGRLGTGRNLQATKLSVGLHTISLVGIDSDQNKVRRSILVEVVAQ
jgi:hypothetical protein